MKEIHYNNKIIEELKYNFDLLWVNYQELETTYKDLAEIRINNGTTKREE